MGLKHGWIANVTIESIWREDESLIDMVNGEPVNRAPVAALEAWKEDADASHLRPYATNGQPTIIRFRSLNPDEMAVVDGHFVGATMQYAGISRAWLAAFRIGVDFPGLEKVRTAEGGDHSIIVKEHGLRMLALPFVQSLMEQYPGIVAFYGSRIIDASRATVAEKKSIIAAVHADAIIGGGVHDGYYGNVTDCGGCVGCNVGMREQWACPDLGIEKEPGMFQPVPGTDEEFPDCPAYYLRTARMGLPAEHLIDGVTHPDQKVSAWAFEVESGARNIESLPPKGIELVHLRLREVRKRDRYAEEKRKANSGR